MKELEKYRKFVNKGNSKSLLTERKFIEEKEKDSRLSKIQYEMRKRFSGTPKVFQEIVFKKIEEIHKNIEDTITESNEKLNENLGIEFNVLKETYNENLKVSRVYPMVEREFSRINDDLRRLSEAFKVATTSIIVEKSLEYLNRMKNEAYNTSRNDIYQWESVKRGFPAYLHELQLTDLLKISK